MKFLVIGCGSIGKRHIRNLKSLGYNDIIAYDVKKERLKEVEEYNVTTFDILDDAFNQKIDAVLVCTPSSLHLQPALLAVEHGSHVFIEKPISHNLDGLDELIDIAEEKGLVTMVGFNMRFEQGLRTMKKLLDEKAIGKVTSAICIVGQYLPDQHPWEDYRHGYAANKSLGGGVILDGIHELDYISWFFGDINELFCFADKLSSLEMDTEDTAAILLRFENNTMVVIQMDYVKRTYERTCEIIGEEGILKWDFEEHTVKMFSAKTKDWETIQDDKEYDINKMYVDEMDCFIGCINGKMTPPVDAVSGKRILEVALAAKESANTKKVMVL
jgi:predicted dehydrogenase